MPLSPPIPSCEYFANNKKIGCLVLAEQFSSDPAYKLEYYKACRYCNIQQYCWKSVIIMEGIFEMLDGCALAIVGFYLYFSKRYYNKHPYRLLAIACMMQSYYFFTYIRAIMNCHDGIYSLLVWSFGMFPVMAEHGFSNGMKIWVSPSFWEQETILQFQIDIYQYTAKSKIV